LASSKILDAPLKQSGVDVASHRIELKASIASWKCNPMKAFIKPMQAKQQRIEEDYRKAELENSLCQ
jgi:hypothetical protein